MRTYVAHAMTNRTGAELIEESQDAVQVLYDWDIEALDPVLAEGIKPTKKKIMATPEQMAIFWKRDKQLIRESHAVIDLTPDRKSEGSAHEIGYARYFLYKPVVRVYPKGKMPPAGLVPWIEDDFITDDLNTACAYLITNHGTFWKRTKWRLSRLNRCYLKAVYYGMREWVN